MQSPLCKVCPREQKNICMSRERPLAFLSYPFAQAWQTMPWDAKAEEVFVGGLSDGTVSHAQGQAISGAIEQYARSKGHHIATIADMAEAIAASATDFSFQVAGDIDPAYTAAVATMPDPTRVIAAGRTHIRERRAELGQDPGYAKLFVDVRRAVDAHDHQAHDMVMTREMTWCGHVPHVLAIMMTRQEFDASRQTALVDHAEQIAQERGHAGVTPRDFETALLRSATAA